MSVHSHNYNLHREENKVKPNYRVLSIQVHLTPKMFFFFFTKIIELIFGVIDLVKSLIQSMARQSTSKCRHFSSRPSLIGHGSRAECDVKLRTR